MNHLINLVLLMSLAVLPFAGFEPRDHREEVITVSAESQTVRIPITKVESLAEYLNQYDSNERDIEKSRIGTDAFSSNSGVIYADIRYSCGVKLCNHALAQVKNGQIRSVALSDSSIMMQHAFSPDEKYLAFLLGRNEGVEIVRNRLAVVDTDDLKLVMLQGPPEAVHHVASTDYTASMFDLKWINEKTLQLSLPDTKDYSFETLRQWNRQGERTKNIVVTVQDS